LGWVLFVSSDCGLSFRKLKAIRISSIVALVVMLFYKGDGFNNNVKLYEIVASTFAAISMWSFVVGGKGNVNPTIVVRLLSFVGKCSFSIYIIMYLGYTKESSSMLISMLSFCFVIAFGIAMYFIVENPSERFRKNFSA
jgi:peptidoglycan/LPS O-acetylase OafA/YrhL